MATEALDAQAQKTPAPTPVRSQARARLAKFIRAAKSAEIALSREISALARAQAFRAQAGEALAAAQEAQSQSRQRRIQSLQ